MKIAQEMTEALSRQINEELFSAYLYQSMSIWANSQNLTGMSSWMEIQAGEELEHARRLHKYITERGGDTVLEAIAVPQNKWDDALSCMQAAYDHEQHITANFQKLSKIASEANDYTTLSALQWFVDEQVEEEDTSSYWVEKFKMASSQPAALLFVDGQMGARKA